MGWMKSLTEENMLTSAGKITMRGPDTKKRMSKRGLAHSPHVNHKAGPEGDFRCDGHICQSLFVVEAEQLINLLSH